jgi:hypothetical protein
MTTGHQYDLPYLVEQWDDSDSRVEELIARGLKVIDANGQSLAYVYGRGQKTQPTSPTC